MQAGQMIATDATTTAPVAQFSKRTVSCGY
jgi:hypothetical protein